MVTPLEAAQVAARKAIESQYTGKCTVIENQPYRKENKSNGYKEVIILENQPCKLSYSNISSANQTSTVATVSQVVKLFIAPEISINPGSKLTITQAGVTTDYERSGKPAVYSTHQEIILELFKGYV